MIYSKPNEDLAKFTLHPISFCISLLILPSFPLFLPPSSLPSPFLPPFVPSPFIHPSLPSSPCLSSFPLFLPPLPFLCPPPFSLPSSLPPGYLQDMDYRTQTRPNSAIHIQLTKVPLSPTLPSPTPPAVPGGNHGDMDSSRTGETSPRT